MRGSETRRMAGTMESSSVGIGHSQAKWARGKSAERMVLGDLVEEDVYLHCKNI